MRKLSCALVFLAVLFAVIPGVPQTLFPGSAGIENGTGDAPGNAAVEPDDPHIVFFFPAHDLKPAGGMMAERQIVPADCPENSLWRPPIQA